jgi:hypothetical protein
VRNAAFILGAVALSIAATAPMTDAEEPTKALTIALPASGDLDKLTDLTAQFAGASIHYNPAKLKGTVRLSVRGQVTPAELWAVFNQVLIGQGFTSIITGLPPVYGCLRMHGKRRSRQVNYRLCIEALIRKPGAFTRLIYRDELHPSPTYAQTWLYLRERVSEHAACRTYVRHASGPSACLRNGTRTPFGRDHGCRR